MSEEAFLGVDFIIFTFTSVDSPHVRGMTEDKGNIFLFAEISQPVLGEHALCTDDHVFPVWFYSPEKGFGICPNIPVQNSFSLPVKDAQVHFIGVQVDSAVKIVLFGIKSHEKASFVEVIGYPHYSKTGLPGMRGGLLYYQWDPVYSFA